LVAFPGFQSVVVAYLFGNKPIIFDSFASIYDSMVNDRAQVSKYSIKGFYFWFIDWLSMKLSSVVLFDTVENMKYAIKTFGVQKNKLVVIPVGSIYNGQESAKTEYDSKTHVFFYGSYVPLQGISTIIKSAKILEPNQYLDFEIVGDGQEKNKILSLVEELDVKNITFTNKVSAETLKNKIVQSDICLGIFGGTEKTSRVIPNKVYDYVALGKPAITLDTPAIREIFDDEDLILVEDNSPEKLAVAIDLVYRNLEKYESLAKNLKVRTLEVLSQKVIAKIILDSIKK